MGKKEEFIGAVDDSVVLEPVKECEFSFARARSDQKIYTDYIHLTDLAGYLQKQLQWGEEATGEGSTRAWTGESDLLFSTFLPLPFSRLIHYPFLSSTSQESWATLEISFLSSDPSQRSLDFGPPSLFTDMVRLLAPVSLSSSISAQLNVCLPPLRLVLVSKECPESSAAHAPSLNKSKIKELGTIVCLSPLRSRRRGSSELRKSSLCFPMEITLELRLGRRTRGRVLWLREKGTRVVRLGCEEGGGTDIIGFMNSTARRDSYFSKESVRKRYQGSETNEFQPSFPRRDEVFRSVSFDPAL